MTEIAFVAFGTQEQKGVKARQQQTYQGKSGFTFCLHCLTWHSATANQNSHRGNESPSQIKGVDSSMSIESLYHHLLLPVFAIPGFCANMGGN